MPFFAYPADIRKVIYTTNAVESLNMSLRKVIKTRGSFPTEEAAMKLLYLALDAHREEVDHASAGLESRLAALRDPARRPSSQSGGGLNCNRRRTNRKRAFSEWGSAPKPPRFSAFAPGLLDRGDELTLAPRNPGL